MHMYDKKTPRDRIHFRQRTEATFGKKLEDIELKGKDREEHWNKIERAFDLLATVIYAGKKWRRRIIHGIKSIFSRLYLRRSFASFAIR